MLLKILKALTRQGETDDSIDTQHKVVMREKNLPRKKINLVMVAYCRSEIFLDIQCHRQFHIS